jgi:predicted SnoaL-like aldol condensation-catalyzing enzyme
MIESTDLPPIVVTKRQPKETSPYPRRDTDQETINKAIVRKLFEDVWNNAEDDAAVKYLAANYTNYAVGPLECIEGQCRMTGPISMQALVGCLRSPFPNVTFYILQMIAEGDRVAVHFIGAGTHKGKFGNVDPSGEEVDIVGFAIHRIVNRKLMDSYHFLRIIGLGLKAHPD